MAQTDRETVPQQPLATTPQAPQAYRPVSGLAIAGLTLACLFALLVAITSGVGLIPGVPFFLPEWMLGIPIVAVVLCFVALQRIRASEGTLAGLKPARWGLWLALLTALGYFAFSFCTGLAITQQADSFLRVQGPDSGFFPRLQDAKDNPEQIDQAFVLTLKPSERPANVKDLAKLFDRPGKNSSLGFFSQFRHHFLTRAIAHSGTNAHVEALGSQQWSYENHGYKVQRRYRVTTSQAVFDLRITTQSAEIPGSQRKWLVVFPPTTQVTLTPMAVGLKKAWMGATTTVQSVLAEGSQDGPSAKYRDDSDWEKLAAGHATWQGLRDQVLGMLSGTSKIQYKRGTITQEEHFGQWKIVDGKLRFHIGFSLQFMGPEGRPFTAEGEWLVEGAERRYRSDEDLVELPSNPEGEWRIVAVKFRRVAPSQTPL
ncbi:MAG: hypothetical protein FJ271_16440 [Planctomycetes bacterium]|nr:hypothetical protein [Planctomycetota bacterium]